MIYTNPYTFEMYDFQHITIHPDEISQINKIYAHQGLNVQLVGYNEQIEPQTHNSRKNIRIESSTDTVAGRYVQQPTCM